MKRWLTMGMVLMTMLGSVVLISSQPAEAQSTCAGQPVTVYIGAGQSPTNGPDVILGTNGDDVINGLGGNDRICGLGGNDRINGGAGNDVITGGSGADVLDGSSGDDIIRGQGGNDRLSGNTGSDRLYGGENNDVMTGDAHNDLMWGEGGRDTMYGGDGSDRLYGGGADDSMNGGNSNDHLYGQAGNDTLHGAAGTDFADGGGGTNACTAETISNCVVDPPQWIAGSALEVSRLSRWNFTVEWCCLAISQPDQYELTITSSAGISQTEYIQGHFAPSFTVSSFGGFALTPGETFQLRVVALNAGGRSTPLYASAEVPTPFLEEVSETSTRSSGTSRASDSGLGDCRVRTTTSTFGMHILGKKTVLGTLVAVTDACHNGSTVTDNLTTERISCRVPISLELFLNDDDPVVVNGGTGQATARNIFKCRISGAFGVSLHGVNLNVEFDETSVVQHTVRWQSGATAIDPVSWLQ